MSTIYDVASMTVDGGTAVNVSAPVTTISVVTALTDQIITITPPATTEVVEVQTAGPQGAPGLQNVYIQSTDPAQQFGWGPAQTNFVWIQV
jgi:hypothetical protein